MKKRMLSLLLAVALVLGFAGRLCGRKQLCRPVLDTHWAHPHIEDVTERAS